MLYASLLIGNGRNSLHYLIDLHERVNNNNNIDHNHNKATESKGLPVLVVSEENKQRLNHYYPWFRKDLSFMIVNPRVTVISSASNQPWNSLVKQDMNQRVFNHPSPSHSLLSLPTGNICYEGSSFNNYWIRERIVHDRHDFDPILMDLNYHTKTVTDIAWNLDGTRIASASEDGTILIIDTQTVSGSVFKVLLWDIETTDILQTITTSFLVNSVTWSYDNEHDYDTDNTRSKEKLALAGNSNSPNTAGIIKVYSFEENIFHLCYAMELTAEEEYIFQIAWNNNNTTTSPSSSLKLASLHEEIIKIWNGENGELLITIPDVHYLQGGPPGFTWNHTGDQIISCSGKFMARNVSVKVWDVSTGNPINSYINGKNETYPCSHFSLNSQDSLLAMSCTKLSILDLKTNTILFHDKKGCHSVKWHPVSNHLLTAVNENIKLWNFTNLTEQREELGAFTAMAFHRNFPFFAIGNEFGTLFIWDWKGNEEEAKIINTIATTSKNIWKLQWHPVEQNQITVHHLGSYSIDMWIVDTSASPSSLLSSLLKKVTFQNQIQDFEWVHPNKLLLSLQETFWKVYNIQIWDIEANIPLLTIRNEIERAPIVHWSINYSKILFNMKNDLRICDASTGEIFKTFQNNSTISYFVWSPNPSLIAFGSDSTLKIWNWETDQIIYSVSLEYSLRDLSWNKEGNQLIVGGFNEVKLWDNNLGKFLISFPIYPLTSKCKVNWDNHDMRMVCMTEYSIKCWDCVLWKEE